MQTKGEARLADVTSLEKFFWLLYPEAPWALVPVMENGDLQGPLERPIGAVSKKNSLL